MKFAAIEATTQCVLDPTAKQILPSPFDRSVAVQVANEVAAAARKDEVCLDA